MFECLAETRGRVHGGSTVEVPQWNLGCVVR